MLAEKAVTPPLPLSRFTFTFASPIVLQSLPVRYCSACDLITDAFFSIDISMIIERTPAYIAPLVLYIWQKFFCRRRRRR